MAIITAISLFLLTTNRAKPFMAKVTVTLPIDKVLRMYSKALLSSMCSSITKLNENALTLPFVTKKHPSPSVKPLNHSIKSRDKTSFLPSGNSMVREDLSVLEQISRLWR